MKKGNGAVGEVKGRVGINSASEALHFARGDVLGECGERLWSTPP